MSGNPGAIKSRDDVREMFDRISRRYDLMNRVMTGGQDVRWRKKTVKRALAGGATRVLDIATGTGDLAFALSSGGATDVTGLDLAPEMIAAANRKRGATGGVTFVVGDAMHLLYPDGTFDAVTVSFGLRNMPDYREALREMARVLRPDGRLVCLELTAYRKPILGGLFRFYFHRVVPVLGACLSGDAEAYRYLPNSVDSFPDSETLATMMREVGFQTVMIEKLGAGTVAMHTGIRDD